MTSALTQLNLLQTEVATRAYQAVPLEDWASAKICAKYTPDGSVGDLDFAVVLPDGKLDHETIPDASLRVALYALTKRHWQSTQGLGQARCFKMILALQCSRQFSVDFEYKNTITELDMVERG